MVHFPFISWTIIFEVDYCSIQQLPFKGAALRWVHITNDLCHSF